MRRCWPWPIPAVIPIFLLPVTATWSVPIACAQISSNTDGLTDQADKAFRLAAGFYEREQWEDASEAWRDFLQAFPQDPQAGLAGFYYGESELQLERWESARSCYQNFIINHPLHPLIERAMFRLAEANYRLHDPQAIRMLEAFLQAYPQSEWRLFAFNYLGNARLAQGDYSLAQRVFELGLREFPADERADELRLGLAAALLQTGDRSNARRFLTPLLESARPDLRAQADFQLALCELKDSQFDSARERLLKVVSQLTPEDIWGNEARFYLARCQVNAENWNAAREQYDLISTAALPAEFRWARAFDLGLIAYRQGQTTEARTAWQTLASENLPAELGSSTLRWLCQLDWEANDPSGLVTRIDNLSNSQKPWAATPEVQTILGRALHQQGDFARASQVFDALLSSASPETSVSERRTWEYLHAMSRLGTADYSGALQILQGVKRDSLPSELQTAWELTRGLAYQGQQNWASAADSFRQVINELKPSPAERTTAIYGAWLAAVELGEWEIADRHWNEINSSASQSISTEWLLRAGLLAQEQQRWDTAEQLYRRVIDVATERSQIAEGLAGIGWIAFQKEDLPNAVLYLEQVVTNHSDYPQLSDVYLTLAKIAETQGQWSTAGRYYRLCGDVATEPQRQRLTRYKMAVALRKAGNPRELTLAHSTLVQLLAQPADDYPRDFASYELAWIEHQLGNTAAAERQWVSFVEEFTQSSLWPDAALRLAQIHVQRQNDVAAAELLSRLLATATEGELNCRALFLSGQIGARQKNWSAVKTAMEYVVQSSQEPNLVQRANYWLGESAYQLQQFDESLRFLEPLAANAQFPEPQLQPWILLRISQCWAQKNEWNRASDAVNSALQRFPSSEIAYEFEFVRGRALFARGELQQAIGAFQRVVDTPQAAKSETAAQAQWRIGEALFLQEKFAEAVAAYYRVDSLYDYPQWRAAAMLQAGKCQERLKNLKQATILYRNLIKRYPDSEYAQQARKRLSALERQVNQKSNSNNIIR